MTDREDETLPNTPSIAVYSSPPTYSHFFEHHLQPLQPCLIDRLCTDWAVSERWIEARDGVFTLRMDILKQELGAMVVSVSGPGMNKPENRTMSKFLDDLAAGAVIYAKDVHLQTALAQHDRQDHFYHCPSLFNDDYLNFYLVDGNRGDDYKFLYLGNKGTRTLLHRDVVASHSWSSNLVGWKRWWLVEPKNVPLIHSIDDECAKDLFMDDESVKECWPRLHEVRDAALVVDQAPGQTIFVPSGWYHQVLNLGSDPASHDHRGVSLSAAGEERCLDPVLSINQNWFNSVCLHNIYHHLQREHIKSAEAIHDLLNDKILAPGEPFKVVVENLCKANVGLDFTELFDMMRYRLAQAEQYVCPQLLPPPAYEAHAIRSICEHWMTINLSIELPQTTAIVEDILANHIHRLNYTQHA